MPEKIIHSTKQQTVKLPGGGTVKFFPKFLTKKGADELFKDLKKNPNWIRGIYKMFGKEIPTPRLLWAMRDKNTDITKSYTVTGSTPWTTKMKAVKKRVEKKLDQTLLYAQLNYYRHQDDYIGWHTDSEVMDGDLIASISLGAERKFQMRTIDRSTTTIHEFTLTHGSLLVMDQKAAKGLWKHRVPKSSRKLDGRINITFRNR